MSEEQDPSPQYIKVFNNGYPLQQHDPALLEQILRGNEKSEQIKAMQAGKEQAEKERFLNEMEEAKDAKKDKERKRWKISIFKK